MIIVIKDKDGKQIADCEIVVSDEDDCFLKGELNNCTVDFDMIGLDDDSDEAIIINL